LPRCEGWFSPRVPVSQSLPNPTPIASQAAGGLCVGNNRSTVSRYGGGRDGAPCIANKRCDCRGFLRQAGAASVVDLGMGARRSGTPPDSTLEAPHSFSCPEDAWSLGRVATEAVTSFQRRDPEYQETWFSSNTATGNPFGRWYWRPPVKKRQGLYLFMSALNGIRTVPSQGERETWSCPFLRIWWPRGWLDTFAVSGVVVALVPSSRCQWDLGLLMW
jgi:hypothetical protein